ncbi:MAG: hypothetical protein HY376_02885 [Candidatus Blackburnbacteria bacterium]|nr:hypothetical protein [Candidatus Blackburnbacteria bacterium]
MTSRNILSVKIRAETLRKYKAWCGRNGVKINRKTEMLIEQFLSKIRKGGQ